MRHRTATLERALQDVVASVLSEAGISFRREEAIAQDRLFGKGNRPDFMVGGVVVEVKVDHSGPALVRQLARYADVEGVTAIILVTTSRRLAAAPPSTLNGKDVFIVLVEVSF